LSIYSTRALFHKYGVAMENRLICEILILSEGSSLSIAEYQVNVVPLSELITMIAC